MRLVYPKIIFTTHYQLVLKCVFSRYYQLCIYISISLLTSTWATGLAEGGSSVYSELHQEIAIKWMEKCTWKLWSCECRNVLWRWLCEYRDELGGWYRVTLEMQLKVVIQRTLEICLDAVIKELLKCTGIPWRNKMGYTDGGWAWVSLELHLGIVMEWGWSCTWRLWSSNFGDVLVVCDWDNVELHFKVAINNILRG